jgi:hypothetical protein
VVTNEQLYLLVGVPLLFNVTLVGVLISYINAKFQGQDARFDPSIGASTTCETCGERNCAAWKKSWTRG